MKLRFKRNCDDNTIFLELENRGRIVKLDEKEISNFIQNREINNLIFTDDMTKEEKINIKLMLDSVISKMLSDV